MSNLSVGLVAATVLIGAAQSSVEAFSPPRPIAGCTASCILRPSYYCHQHGSSRLFIKNPWGTSNVEAETETEHAKNGEQNTDNSNGPGFRFFDNEESITNGQQPNNEEVASDSLNKKGPLGFLQRDVTPLAMDDEWAYSLNSADASVQDDGGDSTGQDVVMMAGAGLIIALIVAGVTMLGMGVLDNFSLPSAPEAINSVENLFADPTATLEGVVNKVESMGPTGFLFFGLVYTIAEILAIPAIPLTASAGYLFGVVQGTSVVLVSASIAAAVAFIIGRTLLRSYVEGVLEEYPKFQRIDKAVGREGFKLMVLLRLSPIFPFALSNYLYGATSVGFWPYFFGTMIGFTPGTIAYVSTGSISKALTLDSASAYPWYVYAGGFAVLTAFLKFAADVATGIIDELDEEGQ